MKTKPNNKILFHHFLITILIIPLVFYIENKSLRYVVISFILLNLLLNETTHLKLTTNKLEIYRNILFVIPTFRYTIKVKDITGIHLLNYKHVYQDSLSNINFEASVITKIITGPLFYKADNILVIDLYKNKKLVSEINSNERSVINIITKLQPDSQINKQDYEGKQ